MLEIDGICKSYDRRMVLKPVHFVLPAGQCLGITGANGSGKSTLLRLLAQVEAPDSGEIRFRGANVLGNRSFLRSTVGYVPQEDALLPELTVHQQMALWKSACSLRGPLPEDILELLGLPSLWNKRISALSGGMRRRVSIAMALLSRPEILIMDEATTGLDQQYCQALLPWLEAFLLEGGRMLWCSHDTQEIDRLCGSRINLIEGECK